MMNLSEQIAWVNERVRDSRSATPAMDAILASLRKLQESNHGACAGWHSALAKVREVFPNDLDYVEDNLKCPYCAGGEDEEC